jgi:hypothetical protein
MKIVSTGIVAVALCLAAVSVSPAALVVKVISPKTAANKVDIKLELKNTFTNNIESARAAVFLLDDHGKMVGQAAHWIIGGKKDKPSLAPTAKTTYDFIVPTDKPFTQTKIMVNRLILGNGKLANPFKDVQILQEQKK